ncbi:MAG: spondin domain-containing protein [Verrucomicrobiales bacterium]|nr:spondin domain-containing protein [Verrucomicrobiales bacterium]
MVTVENLAPPNGTYLTPMWVGFHDGTFDLYDLGAPASMGIERIAEDGNVAPLSAAFAASGLGSVDGVLGGGPIAPGTSASTILNLDPNSPASRYFSYASMIIPSNDAFIANGNPLSFEIFDGSGAFLGANFIVLGSMVRDAGTEVNDEIPANTAFFGQATPDTGVDENGVVHEHLGFLAVGSGGILDAPDFAAADFTTSGYQVARVTISAVPENLGTGPILLLSTMGLLAVRWARRPMRACA